MAAEGGVESAALSLDALETALRENPTAFEFFAAVRALERLQPGRAGVGRFGDPAQEVVRFSVNPTIAFPPNEVHEIALPPEGEAPRMSVNFMGLTGPLGVLPLHYTLLTAERKRGRDTAMGEFFDIFHHRILSLFYRAWEKHRFAIAYERGEDDRLREHLLDLVGMGAASARDLLPVPMDVLVFYAGLFAPQQRGAVALEQLIGDFFGVPAEVEQFVGGWYPLPTHDQCAVGEESDASNRLGLGAVAGDEVWDQQARVRIRLGPLTRSQFDAFLPTGSAYEPLRALARFFSNEQFDFEVQLVLARDEVPGCILGDDTAAAQPLGWSTWIRSVTFGRNADDTVLTL